MAHFPAPIQPLETVALRAAHVFTLRDFDFELPPELIAQHPAAERSGSRLLDGSSTTVVDRIFHELPGLLNAGDLLVFNDTKVVKARIFGEKASGGRAAHARSAIRVCRPMPSRQRCAPSPPWCR